MAHQKWMDDRSGLGPATEPSNGMSHMTAKLTDGTEITDIHKVVEGSNGVHLKMKVEGGGVQRAAYIPYPQLGYVYQDT